MMEQQITTIIKEDMINVTDTELQHL